MNKVVIDTGVFALHLNGNPTVKSYFDSISSGRSRGMMAEVNLAEAYYKICQKQGRQVADLIFFQVRKSGLEVVHSADMVRLAGLEKCRQALKVSLADCFALALAKMENALLLTTDSELAKAKDVHVRHIEF